MLSSPEIWKSYKGWQPLKLPIILLLCLGSGSSCVYRFSNLYAPPRHRIALEAIYNTEARHLPHDRIWQAVQVMLARSGRLAPYHAAEQLLRIHLKDSATLPSSAHTELQLSAEVELWDLTRRELLFNTTYRLNETYQTIFAEPQVPRANWFIRSEEARADALSAIGAELARLLQRDLFF